MVVTFSSRDGCLTWAFLGRYTQEVEQIRIHNSDAGYFLERYEEQKMENRHRTVVEAMQMEFKLNAPHKRDVPNIFAMVE
eukprot:TRINITY_DN14982_c0_g1_i1.p1 TRINITY_DN14982_c0_g1~~TRINITY_DN14982_c0_g1_i1.p1  ORF type:complete len:80 (-),score=16.07 TRINITY_DN14982_c0_g1_i1:50-289(-)